MNTGADIKLFKISRLQLQMGITATLSLGLISQVG